MAKGQFALSIRKFAEKVDQNTDQVVRHVVLSVGSSLVERSPVGNPSLWKSNQHSVYGRETHNMFVGAINADIDANPDNFTAGGNLRRGVKRARRAGKKKLADMYPMSGPAGYTGGRFRANWQLQAEQPSTITTDDIDPTGQATIGKFTTLVASMKAGGLIYFSNNLVYGPRLEVGWSSQAPNGMVEITAIEFTDYVNQAVQAMPK